jgi:integrase
MIKRIKPLRKDDRRGWKLDTRIDGRRIRERFHTRKEAEDYKWLMQGDALRKKFNFPADRARITLKVVSDTWIEELKRRGRSDAYKSRTETALKKLQEILKPLMPVTKIEDRHLLDYVGERFKEGLASGSIACELRVIMACFNYARETIPQLQNWKLPNKPRVKLSPGRDRLITLDEEKRIVEAFKPAPDDSPYVSQAKRQGEDIFRLALLTAMRIGEMFSLRWEAVNFDRSQGYPNGWIKVRTEKTGDPRILPLNTESKALLQRRKQATGPGFVFPSPGQFRSKSGSQVSFHKTFHQACIRAKVPVGRSTPGGVVFHDTRHTAITRMLHAGADLATVMKIAGHRSPTTALRYAHATPASKQAAVDSLVHFESTAVGKE